MQVPFFTTTREYQQYKADFDHAIQSVLDRGDFVLGQAVREFEQQMQSYSQAQYAVGVANGSDALVLGSDILGYKNGAEVLTPTFTFFASTSCLARLGAKPVFTDVDTDTFNMDVADAAQRITAQTKGILPVHLFAQMADMTGIMDLAQSHNLTVLEDSAEAVGMKQEYRGEYKMGGTIGDMGVYSFFPTKTLGGYGDGGMLVCNDLKLAEQAKSLRVHGSRERYIHELVGYNSRLDSLQAAILSVKLSRIEKSIAQRAKLAELYREQLSDVEQVQLPVIKPGNKEVYYVFNLKVEKRDELNAFLQENGIGTSIYYPIPLHLQKCFKHLGYKKGDFPVAEKLCTQVLSLPMYPELQTDELSYVCDKIKEFYR